MSRALCTLLACLLLAGVFATNVYRAIQQPITHDEALTYRVYVASPWYYLIDHFDANNHVVNSLACRVTTLLFGVSELSMRLPCLAGGALYLLTVFWLCRYVFGGGPFFLIAVSLLTLNPLVLDFLAIARGYGIALALMLVGIYQLFRYLDGFEDGSLPGDGRKRLVLSAVCFALTVHSNLSFLIGAGSVALVFLGITIHNGRSTLDSAKYAELIQSLRKDFIRPGLWVFGVLAVTLVKMRLSHFYIGEDTLKASLQGMGQASLNHHHVLWPWDTESPAFQTYINVISTWGTGLVLLAVLAVGLPTAVRWLRARDGFHAFSKNERFLLFCGASLLMSCIILLGLHFVLNVRYPHERTGLYLVPLFVLGFLTVIHGMLLRGKSRLLLVLCQPSTDGLVGQVANLSLDRMPSCPTYQTNIDRALGIPGLALAVLLIVQFAAQFPATYYREWKYDSTSREVFQVLADYGNRSSNARTRVACHFFFFPSLSFYCAANHLDRLELLDTRYYNGPSDVCVYDCKYPPADKKLTPIFQSDASGVVISVVENKQDQMAAREKTDKSAR